MTTSRRAFLRLSGAAAAVSLAPRLHSQATDAAQKALRRKLASDPLRPQYHLLPASNWMNDPNGPIFFRGRYHMFHQYNPKGAVWGNMHWAHATSPDMVHWFHEPIALAPTPGGYDRDGVFSGSAVLDRGTPTVIYTGVLPPGSDAEATLRDGTHVWREVQCLAVSHDDELLTWSKLSEPVIASPPPGLKVTGFRDPVMWREGDSWMLILGSGFQHRGGAILLYRSTDLRKWTYLHTLVEASGNGKDTVNPVDNGEMWECPDFFPLGDRHVLLISTMGKVWWKVGTYRNQRFSPEKEGVVDWGAYYAAKTMPARDGNRILWGWIPETRPEAEYSAAGWAGVMSLPRVLSLNAEHDLEMDVAPAVQQLRRSHAGFSGNMSSARQKILDAVRINDLAAELSVEFQPRPGQAFSLRLRPESGEDFAVITCVDEAGRRELHVNNLIAELRGGPGSPVRLRMFLDGSVLEVSANGTTVMTARIYRAPSGPLRLSFEGEAEVSSVDFWQMQPISRDRLTS
jgi:beta-fructofuranosidase